MGTDVSVGCRRDCLQLPGIPVFMPPAPDSQTRLGQLWVCCGFQEWTWSLVSGESVDVECLVLEHSSEVSCIGRQVPFNLLTEARVVCRPQVGVTLSWPIHLLKPKQTQTQLEWW